MTQEKLANAGSEDVHELKLHILKLEAEGESSHLKIKRLVAAIKADRIQNEEKLQALKKERDRQEDRAEELESKIVQIMERVKIESSRDDATVNLAVEEAKEALKEAENKILMANESATTAERALQQKDQELQKVMLVGKKKAREAQVALDDLKAMEEKSNKLVEALKTLREENQRLKAGLDSSQSSGNSSEELEMANQRAAKLEQAVRRLRQMNSELQAESKDKDKAYEERLRTAEALLSAAEERAKNAASLDELTPTLRAFIPPPPPPPLPKYKLAYEIKINRTGQASNIEGEPVKLKPKNVFVDSIVDAIKKGVTLRKTGLRSDKEDDTSESTTIIAPVSEIDDLNVEDAFAAMAREIAINKQKREREKTQQQGEVTKKKGGELDNLLAELSDLDALIDD